MKHIEIRLINKIKTCLKLVAVISKRALAIFLCLHLGSTFAWGENNRNELGLLVHVLVDGPDDKRINNSVYFDNLADQVLIANVDYLIVTLGQNSGFYVENNPYLKSLCGIHSSDSDFFYEFVKKIKSNGLKLYFYLPFRSPQKNKEMMRCLSDVDEWLPAPSMFVDQWSEVVNEWGKKYGELLDGWWFDGAYNLNGIKVKEVNKFCRAAINGNSHRLIALNSGEGIQRLSKRALNCQNWMAGEINDIKIIKSMSSGGLKPHFVTYLGSDWGKAGVRYRKKDLKYLSKINPNAMITLDVSVSDMGFINYEQINFIRKLKDE